MSSSQQDNSHGELPPSFFPFLLPTHLNVQCFHERFSAAGKYVKFPPFTSELFLGFELTSSPWVAAAKETAATSPSPGIHSSISPGSGRVCPTSSALAEMHEHISLLPPTSASSSPFPSPCHGLAAPGALGTARPAAG